MDYYLVHRAKCRAIVIIEMVLAVLRVVLISLSMSAFIYYYSVSHSGTHESGRGGAELREFVFHYWLILMPVLCMDVILILLGRKVLRACAQGADFRKGISACRTWCRMELFRMLLFIISFLFDVYDLQFDIHEYTLKVPIMIVLLFGWFFVNEFRKELMVKSTSHLQLVTQPVNGFQTYEEPQVVYFPPSVPNVYNYQY